MANFAENMNEDDEKPHDSGFKSQGKPTGEG
jgi:hypothetical protein